MKRRLFLLSILTSLSLCGCDALDAFFDERASIPEENNEQVIPDDSPKDDGKETPTIESICIDGDLIQKEYIVGDSWNHEGLVVVGHFSNDKDELLPETSYEFRFDSERPALGITSLNVYAKLLDSTIVSENKTFTVSVEENVVPTDKQIVEIIINGKMDIVNYNENDNWSSVGLTVTGFFDDDTESILPSDEYDFIFNPTKAVKGTTKVSVYAKLKDKDVTSETVQYNVTVNSTVVPTNHTVTFAANGGFGSMNSDTTNGYTYVAPQCGFTYSGYKFKKWALNSISGTLYEPGETIENIHSNIVLYATWTKNDDGGQSGGDDYNGYYKNIDADVSASSLLQQLRELNADKRTSTVGYSSMGTSPSGSFRYTDYDTNYIQYDSNGHPYGTRIISFYSGNSSTSFNREHVWPKSHGGNLVEADIHMPRPTIASENGSRGNSFYVEGMKDGKYGWDPAMESFGEETYRGDSARIIFYCVIANSNLSLVELEYHETSNSNRDNLMGKLSDMLKWNLQYPVNDREQRRNDGAEYLQGNRNPFIDHPEYACKIWGNTNDATKAVCGIK